MIHFAGEDILTEIFFKVSVMRRRLKTPNNMMGDGVARVFLRALVQIIGGYRDALRFRQGEQITFCREAFLHSRQPALRPFLESMLHLQIFQQFIEERLEMLNSGQVICGLSIIKKKVF
jgi:DENN domain-containing protein 1